MNIILIQITMILAIGLAENSVNKKERKGVAKLEDYFNHLLLKGNNYTSEADSLPCRNLDPHEQLLYQIRDKAVHVCDLCPNFPQKQLVDVFLNNVPIEMKSHTVFSECYGHCYYKDDCVAFSYERNHFLCLLYNSTIGKYVDDLTWTTVLMTQPVGILEDWMYTRHTSLSGEILTIHNDDNFLTCLNRCDEHKECRYVSYSFETSDCLSFSSEEKIYSVDLNYGFITAMRISSLPVEGNELSRFRKYGYDLLDSILKNGVQTDQNCSNLKKDVYSKECYSCDYPEKTEPAHNNLPMCSSTELALPRNEITTSIEKYMKKCLDEPSCIGVGVISKTNKIRILTIENLLTDDYSTRFLLRYPKDNSGVSNFMKTYDLMFHYEIIQFSNKPNSFHETTEKSMEDCLKLFESDPAYVRMSYGNEICKVSSEEVFFKYQENGNCVGIIKKPSLTSPLYNYMKAPRTSISQNLSLETHSCNNCEVECASKCNTDYRDWCTQFSIQFNSDKDKRCFFFNFLDTDDDNEVILEQKENEHFFFKLNNLDFSLDSLNELNQFQPSDICNCFQDEKTAEQRQTTFSSLDAYDFDNGTTDVSLGNTRFYSATRDVATTVIDVIINVDTYLGPDGVPVITNVNATVNTNASVDVNGDSNASNVSTIVNTKVNSNINTNGDSNVVGNVSTSANTDVNTNVNTNNDSYIVGNVTTSGNTNVNTSINTNDDSNVVADLSSSAITNVNTSINTNGDSNIVGNNTSVNTNFHTGVDTNGDSNVVPDITSSAITNVNTSVNTNFHTGNDTNGDSNIADISSSAITNVNTNFHTGVDTNGDTNANPCYPYLPCCPYTPSFPPNAVRATGVVHTLRSLVEGNSKESFMDIPTVNDIGNEVALRKAIVIGNWDSDTKRGRKFLESPTLDRATSLIPAFAGEMVGKGLKTWKNK